MTHKKVIELAKKFANTYFGDKDKLLEYQQNLEDFYFETTRLLRAVIGEMEGDLSILKGRNIDKHLYALFAKARNKITELSLDIDPANPYLGIQALINWANNRNNKAVMENLDFLLKHYSSANNIEFTPISNVSQARIESINNFMLLVKALQKHMIDHPMMPKPQDLIRNQISNIIPPQEVETNITAK